jgi:hypothetical protein
MPTHTIDLERLYDALDRKRREQEKSWRKVARELDLSVTRFTWMANGGSISLETFATLVVWLEEDPASFLVPLDSDGSALSPSPRESRPSLSERLRRHS